MRAANLTVMKRTYRGGRQSGGITPLLSAGLAVLVAGTLVTFSALALRTGFADSSRRGVAAHGANRTDAAPLVLPSSSPSATKARKPNRTGTETQVADEGGTTNAVVLGSRVGGGEADPAPTPDPTPDERDEIDYSKSQGGTGDDYSTYKGKGRHGHKRGGRPGGHHKPGHHKHNGGGKNGKSAGGPQHP